MQRRSPAAKKLSAVGDRSKVAIYFRAAGLQISACIMPRQRGEGELPKWTEAGWRPGQKEWIVSKLRLLPALNNNERLVESHGEWKNSFNLGAEGLFLEPPNPDKIFRQYGSDKDPEWLRDVCFLTRRIQIIRPEVEMIGEALPECPHCNK